MANQHEQTDEERFEVLERSLTNVAPTQEQIDRIHTIRDSAKALGAVIIFNSTNSRERSVALTNLEETVMWAVKGIVLNG